MEQVISSGCDETEFGESELSVEFPKDYSTDMDSCGFSSGYESSFLSMFNNEDDIDSTIFTDIEDVAIGLNHTDGEENFNHPFED